MAKHTIQIDIDTKQAEKMLQSLKEKLGEVDKAASKKPKVGSGWGKAAFGGIVAGVTQNVLGNGLAQTAGNIVSTLNALAGFIPVLRDMKEFRNALQLASNALELFSKGLEMAKHPEEEVSKRTNNAELLQHRAARNGSTMVEQFLAEQQWSRAFGQDNAQKFMEATAKAVADAEADNGGKAAQNLASLGLTHQSFLDAQGNAITDLNKLSEIVLRAAVGKLKEDPNNRATEDSINALFGPKGSTIIRQALGNGRIESFDDVRGMAMQALDAEFKKYREASGRTGSIEELWNEIASNNDKFAQNAAVKAIQQAIVNPDFVDKAVKDQRDLSDQEKSMVDMIFQNKYGLNWRQRDGESEADYQARLAKSGRTRNDGESEGDWEKRMRDRDNAELQESLKEFLGVDKMDFDAIGDEMKQGFDQVVEAITGVSDASDKIAEIALDIFGGLVTFLGHMGLGGDLKKSYGKAVDAYNDRKLAQENKDALMGLGYRKDEITRDGELKETARKLAEVNPEAWFKAVEREVSGRVYKEAQFRDENGDRTGVKMSPDAKAQIQAAIAAANADGDRTSEEILSILRLTYDLQREQADKNNGPATEGSSPATFQ